MEKEKQLTNLELSKKLRDLGVPQDSLFYWDMRPTNNGIEIKPRGIFYQKPRNGDHDYIISAFTVAELGELLPRRITVDRWTWICFKDAVEGTDIWNGIIVDENKEKEIKRILSETEADARAKMLIFLIEQGYLDIKELNNA